MRSIYFIQKLSGGPIKIGLAGNVKSRLAAIQVNNPEPLQVLCVMEGDRDEEYALHRRFDAYRIHGEWFHPSEEIMALVRSLPFWGYRATKGLSLENHPQWKGTEASLITKRQRLQRRIQVQECQRCDGMARDRRCKDGDYDNLSPDNVLLLCRRCSMEYDGRLQKLVETGKRPRFKTPPSPCSNCGRLWKPLRKTLCRNCYGYQRRTGRARPF